VTSSAAVLSQWPVPADVTVLNLLFLEGLRNAALEKSASADCHVHPPLLVTGFSSAWAANAKTVFVIAMENHNWTQPANEFTGGIQQISQNPSAPYINSLVNGTSPISDQVS
jgi:hypothetical protein